MIVSGTGSVTLTGLSIFDYCKLNDVALKFNQFYVTNNNVSLGVLTDPNDSTYNDMTEIELENLLDGAGKLFYNGSVSSGDRSLIQNDSTVLPLLMTVISNAIEIDMDIYTMFITAKDPLGFKVSVADTTGFSIGHTCTDLTTSATATIGFVDSVNNHIYIKNVSPSPITSGTFGLGNTIQDDTSLTTATMSALDDANYVIQKSCLSYDERLTVQVADGSAFSVAGYISSENGAKGTVTAKSGNTLTVNRSINGKTFLKGDNIDNVETYSSPETTISVDPFVDITVSTLVSVPYLSDGSDILFRVSIRYSSGFPKNLTFNNTAVTEIQIHNVDDSTHLDFRLLTALQMSKISRDVRGNKYRLDEIVYKNGLIDE